MWGTGAEGKDNIWDSFLPGKTIEQTDRGGGRIWNKKLIKRRDHLQGFFVLFEETSEEEGKPLEEVKSASKLGAKRFVITFVQYT